MIPFNEKSHLNHSTASTFFYTSIDRFSISVVVHHFHHHYVGFFSLNRCKANRWSAVLFTAVDVPNYRSDTVYRSHFFSRLFCLNFSHPEQVSFASANSDRPVTYDFLSFLAEIYYEKNSKFKKHAEILKFTVVSRDFFHWDIISGIFNCILFYTYVRVSLVK